MDGEGFRYGIERLLNQRSSGQWSVVYAQGWIWGATGASIEFQRYGVAAVGAEAFLDQVAHGTEEKEEAVELPGAFEGGRKADVKLAQTGGHIDDAILAGGGDINAAPVAQVEQEGSLNLLEQAGAPPFVVATVAGLPGRIARGQLGPGARHGELPEDALQDGALVDGLPAASGCRGRRGDEGLDGLPLFVSEAH